MFITRSLEIFFRSIVNGFTRRSAAIRKCGWSLMADFFLVWFRLRLPTGLGYAHTVPLSRPIEREREDSGGGKKGPSPKAGQEDLIYTPTESEKSSASNQVYAHRWARAPLPCPSNSFIFYIRSALVCLLKKKDRSCVPYVTDPILEQKKIKNKSLKVLNGVFLQWKLDGSRRNEPLRLRFVYLFNSGRTEGEEEEKN